MITFMYPFNGSLGHVDLHSPDWQDVRSQDVKTSFDEAMDGSMLSYKYTPKTQSMRMTISNVSRNKAEELLAFLKLSAGKEVRYIDVKGIQYRGRILTDPGDIVVSAKGPSALTLFAKTPRAEGGSVTLEFEGDPIYG